MTDLNRYMAGHSAGYTKATVAAAPVLPHSTPPTPPATPPAAVSEAEQIAAELAARAAARVDSKPPDEPGEPAEPVVNHPQFLEPELGNGDNLGYSLDPNGEGMPESAAEPEQVDTVRTETPTTETGGASCQLAMDRKSLNQYGWRPFYCGWLKAWWFKAKPWSRLNVFIYLLVKANRYSRVEKEFGQIITIERGCVATSILAMSQRSGRDRKTIKRFLKELQDAGEIEVREMGQQGILIKMLKYGLYVFDDKKWDNGMDNDGATTGQRTRQRQVNPVRNDRTMEAQ